MSERLRRGWRARPTLRVRLTLLYGGMFLLAGSVLVAFLYLYVQRSLPSDNAAVARLSHSGQSGCLRLGSGGCLSREQVAQIASAQRRQTLDLLLRESLLALGVVAAAAVGFGWIMAGRVLRPLQHITETANRVADRSLHERIALQGPEDELKELSDTFDAMLERLDHAFDAQRRFVADASHELRTPLAVNRTLLEVALANPDASAEELRQLVRALFTTNERSERLVDGLLTLARSESQALKRRPVDLSDVAAEAVEQTAGEASRAGVAVHATPDPAMTLGDPVLLERLALNLVQNGIRHNHRGGWVKVTTAPSQQPGWVELVVANTGPTVAPYEVEELFEPFRRLNGDRTSQHHGVGLGLPIVRSVARNHGGEVSAVPRSDGGLAVHVRLPAGRNNAAPSPRAEADGAWRTRS
jgi:signal transduction histidine kinase